MILEYIIITIYSIALILIFMYAIAQLNLLFNYRNAQKKKDTSPKFDLKNINEVPYVTIQLPVYNEMYVMERLLNNIVTLEYPREKLEIQVLDDSTDQSIESTKTQIKKLQKTGINIQHIQRTNREGFKAGALKEGLEIARGEFIAIFDADFLPQKNWLLETIPYFKNNEIGVVQTRWGHINRNYSTLTRIQAFALDAHFTLEQVGRNTKGHFINFNGTAGVWRKECILDAGNWEGDTLTEDLDLSYRAQLKKWKFKYLEHVKTPAELPVIISAARSQQFRWNKGGAENFQKMTKRVLLDKDISLKTKIHSVLHLLNSSMFLMILIVAILSIPMLYIKNEYPHLKSYFYMISFFIVSSIIFFICYWYMFKKSYGGGIKNFLKYTGTFFYFLFHCLGLFLSQ
jgi:cellulose synthase/poly-beta-1,6-N-acetylglucosamine synthase-like glycosyltransferase